MNYQIQMAKYFRTSILSCFLLIFLITHTLKIQGQSQLFQDCETAFPICEMKTYHFESMKGSGQMADRIPQLRAKVESFQETNSFWLRWKVQRGGNLSFIITPLQENDDVDFIVFKVTGKACSQISEVRSMLSGENLEENIETYKNCTGTTGLTPYSNKEFDHAGCSSTSDNFLKSLETTEGEEYVLLVNNFENNSGFSISFEGSTILLPFEECQSNAIDFSITKLFPNPGKDYVHVTYTSKSELPIQYSIISNKGELLKTNEISKNSPEQTITIDTHELSSGTYIIRLKQGEFYASKIYIKI